MSNNLHRQLFVGCRLYTSRSCSNDKEVRASIARKLALHLSASLQLAEPKRVSNLRPAMQDFGFPSACHRIKLTPDGQYIVASGVHAPRIAVYDVEQLALKFDRHFDSEIVDFQVRSCRVGQQ